MIRKIIKGLFGQDSVAPVRPAAVPLQPRLTAGKQVFSGTVGELPEFARSANPSNLIKICQAHAVCEYTPKIEFQRLYTPGRRNAKGEMEIAYEGISVSCSAIKMFGQALALEDRSSQAYRYADLNHVYACCCGDPTKCRFYQAAKEEDGQVTRRFRPPGELDPTNEEEDKTT